MDNSTFHYDLKQLTAKIMATVKDKPLHEPKLGDVLQYMGREKLLLRRKKDEDFTINEVNELSDEARDYLNALQLEKFYSCRMCYNKNVSKRCDFHNKYVPLSIIHNQHSDDFVNFLNSEMGVISFIEMYYSFLSVPQWRFTAVILLKDLTDKFSSIGELLEYYNYKFAPDVDVLGYETLDVDEEE